jgi:hypothetical protein
VFSANLLSNEQLCYQHENANDVAYWGYLKDEAEQFFNRRIKELSKCELIE